MNITLLEALDYIIAKAESHDYPPKHNPACETLYLIFKAAAVHTEPQRPHDDVIISLAEIIMNYIVEDDDEAERE